MGDEEVFEALYRDCRDRLARQLFAVTGNRDEAVEAVQEGFARGWAQWSKVQGLDDPEGWVRRVAYRVAVSRWRRGRRIRSASEDPEPNAATGDRDLDARVDTLAALGALPIRHRQALVLHYLAGLSVEETAAELGVPAGTVKSWLYRGRQQLAARLGAGDEEADEERIGR